MKILMLTSAYPNYVPDLLLHGLRKLFGEQVVDFPRKDVVYQGLCGQPNLDPIPDFMANDDAVDRSDLAAKLATGFFDLVIADIRCFNDQIALLQENRGPLALLDGEDWPAPIPPGPYVILRRETDGSDNSIPLPMGLPAEVIAWIDRHADQPKRHPVGFLGGRSQFTPDRNHLLERLAGLFPDGLVGSWAVGDGTPTPPGRDGYYARLQSCHVVVTLPGAGLDTFRYWENAACTAVHAAKTMNLFIPDPFRDGVEVINFGGLFELAAMVEKVAAGSIDAKAMAQAARQRLLQHHTTEKRAAYCVDRLKRAFGR